MVDLHHHLLPGLDDGSPDLATSVAMARMAAEDGITHVVCTPHASSRYAFEPDRIAARLAELRAALQANAISLILTTGSDFHLSYDNVQDALRHPAKYTIDGKDHLLVELPEFGFSPRLGTILQELGRMGITPILTHPERNATLQRDAALAEWLCSGILVQITAGSVLGEMGRRAQRMAEQLLARRWVHFVATDAHHVRHRPPRMSAARDLIAKRHGSDYANLLCSENPLAVFEGRPLSEQPEPHRAFDGDMTGLHSRPPFWKRLLGRS